MSIGNRIRELRLSRDWSQQELADKANVKQSYISKIERGDRVGHIEMLRKIANAFSISVGLLVETNVPLEKVARISTIQSLIKDMDDTGMDFVESLIKQVKKNSIMIEA